MIRASIVFVFLVSFSTCFGSSNGVADIHRTSENVYKKQAKFLKKLKKDTAQYHHWARNNRKEVIQQEVPYAAVKF